MFCIQELSESGLTKGRADYVFSSIQVLFSQSLLLGCVQVGAVTVVGHHTSFATVAIKIFTELTVGASIQTAIGPRSVPPSRSPGGTVEWLMEKGQKRSQKSSKQLSAYRPRVRQRCHSWQLLCKPGRKLFKTKSSLKIP